MASLDRREPGERRHFERFRKRILSAWLIAVSVFIVWGWASLQQQANDLRAQRIEGTEQRCQLARIGLRLANRVQDPRLSAPLQVNVAQCNAMLENLRNR